MKKKIMFIVLTIVIIVLIYLYFMLFLDEKSVGLLESIIESEDSDLKKKSIALLNISQEKERIKFLKYVYGGIILSYLCGVIYWFGLKKK